MEANSSSLIYVNVPVFSSQQRLSRFVESICVAMMLERSPGLCSTGRQGFRILPRESGRWRRPKCQRQRIRSQRPQVQEM